MKIAEAKVVEQLVAAPGQEMVCGEFTADVAGAPLSTKFKVQVFGSRVYTLDGHAGLWRRIPRVTEGPDGKRRVTTGLKASYPFSVVAVFEQQLLEFVPFCDANASLGIRSDWEIELAAKEMDLDGDDEEWEPIMEEPAGV